MWARPEFEPDEASISMIAAWIRIDKLPLDYYDPGILHVLGSQVGRVLKIDSNTSKRKKGRFARICVELDLNMPLRPLLLINGKAKRVQYESIHLICLHCGRYGHEADQCPHKKNDMMSNAAKEGVQDKTSKHTGEAGNTSSLESLAQPSGTAESGMSFEPWMMVQRRHRTRRLNGSNGKGSVGWQDQRNNGIRARGCHFNTLEVEEREIMGESLGANHSKILSMDSNIDDARTGGGVKDSRVGPRTTSSVGPSKGAMLVGSEESVGQDRASDGGGSC
ncbi:uncharacterized protein LOC114713695 [Neltuma alba]|uniref:uncharacterized protein LOC114713695 n=1 Tax=Neltuma alba TaxID=207710 RepID=UPI0010A499E9|nr:uncharacterized protein LOC114713695 [Prosopis alba]